MINFCFKLENILFIIGLLLTMELLFNLKLIIVTGYFLSKKLHYFNRLL